MQFKVKFISSKENELLINKEGYEVGFNDLTMVETIYENKYKFEYNNLATKKLSPEILPDEVKELRVNHYIHKITQELALKLNKTHKGVYDNSNTLVVQIVGNLSVYVSFNYNPIFSDKSQHYISKVNIEYEFNEEAFIYDWYQAGYPLLWVMNK